MKRSVATGVVTLLIAGLAGACSTSSHPSSAPARSTSPTPSPTSAATRLDPQLRAMLLTSDDIGSFGVSVETRLFKGGNTLQQPTLDACAGHFPSESKRVARIQVGYISLATGQQVVSNEVVRYAPGGTEQAYRELRQVVASCPMTKRTGPHQLQRHFARRPQDREWVAHQVTTTFQFDIRGHTLWSAAVYLYDGNLFDGVYVYGANPARVLAAARSLATVANTKLETAAGGGPNSI